MPEADLRILVFIDKDMVEAFTQVLRDQRVAHGLRPIKEQIVVIQHVLSLLGLDICPKKLIQLGRPSGAPRKEF